MLLSMLANFATKFPSLMLPSWAQNNIYHNANFLVSLGDCFTYKLVNLVLA